MDAIHAAVSEFGKVVAARFATGGGEPEDLLRGPFEHLIDRLSSSVQVGEVVLTGEHHLAEDRVRPDYAVHVAGVLIGFVEIKAPGKGVDTSRYKGHDRRQWQRLACLPNVLYTDGQEFALFRDGERSGEVVRLVGDVETAGAALTVADDKIGSLIGEFLRWRPIPPRRPKEVARIAARLCRVLRDEVKELLDSGNLGLHDLARDWRSLLYPDATDDEFADGYAQTVTFALLLARVEGIELADRDLRDVADDLGSHHTLMARALAVLTDPAVLPKLAVSVETLRRVLSVVDWPKVSKSDPAAWLYFYEDFLEDYDPALRRQTGSYYTPVEAVDPMIRMVDDLLRTRLGHADGFGSPGVTVVDPAAGTGTFLFRIVDRIAKAIKADQGPGAVGPALRKAAKRLVGFEIQAGPFSVAELRLATEYLRQGAKLGPDELRLYLTDTLADPFVEETQFAATYKAIALSRQRANKVKKAEPVVVVIGNPPYRERSRGHGGWVEKGEAESAKTALLGDYFPPRELGLGSHTKHLYNLYVYFWRWATWKVFEHHPGDRGVVAFVTVAGFLNGPGFAEMRSHLRRWADAVWVIDCSPEGHQPDVATRIFPGVQQPICITIALRDDSTGPAMPAPVRFTSVHGQRAQKFETLRDLDLDQSSWVACPEGWHAPFLPQSAASWSALPALDDLLAWSGSGTMPGRTWVVNPSPDVLRRRWQRLVMAPVDERTELLVEHKTDRTIHTHLSDNLPGYPVVGTLASESAACPAPIRYGYRTLDRSWIVPDKRVVNRPNPSLWQIRTAPGQLFVTAPERDTPSAGPSTSFTHLVPDLHHYHGRGGRTYPIWLDSAGERPNVVPGVLDHLSTVYGTAVTGPDLFAYVAAVTAHPAYIERYRADLQTPGLRIPLTADPECFERAVGLGRRVLWLHTYGERCTDAADGRPLGPPRLTGEQRPLVLVAIPDTEGDMPDEIDYDETACMLHVGTGRISGVTPSMWEYETSGYKLIRRWFAKRKEHPEGRRSSRLEDVVASTWDPDWTSELIDLLHAIALLIQLEPAQSALLEEIASGASITVEDLAASGVLPVADRPVAEKPPRQEQL
ncbi:MAG: type ISP restriction/modification enzyme [Acidimicrobiales bacterium]